MKQKNRLIKFTLIILFCSLAHISNGQSRKTIKTGEHLPTAYIYAGLNYRLNKYNYNCTQINQKKSINNTIGARIISKHFTYNFDYSGPFLFYPFLDNSENNKCQTTNFSIGYILLQDVTEKQKKISGRKQYSKYNALNIRTGIFNNSDKFINYKFENDSIKYNLLSKEIKYISFFAGVELLNRSKTISSPIFSPHTRPITTGRDHRFYVDWFFKSFQYGDNEFLYYNINDKTNKTSLYGSKYSPFFFKSTGIRFGYEHSRYSTKGLSFLFNINFNASPTFYSNKIDYYKMNFLIEFGLNIFVANI